MEIKSLPIIALTLFAACDKSSRFDNKQADNEEAEPIEVVTVPEQDYYDSISGQWYGPHADRLNGVDNSPIDTTPDF